MLNLQRGRTLSVETRGDDELVEIRSAEGMLELSVRLTDDGVVLQLDAARISLKATESVDVECKSFNVNAQSNIQIESAGDVHVQGKLVYIN
jgi:phage gp45-like